MADDFRSLAELVKSLGPRARFKRVVYRDAKGRKRYRYVPVLRGPKRASKGK